MYYLFHFNFSLASLNSYHRDASMAQPAGVLPGQEKKNYSIMIAGLNGRAFSVLTSSLSRPW
jgi:hypothetical protein